MKIYQFDAVIQGGSQMDTAFVEFPYDVEKEFGVKGQVKVQATFDGFSYRGSLAKMGHPCHFLILTQSVRKAIGKQPGDSVQVVIRQDPERRQVQVPADLQQLLQKDPQAHRFFAALSYTHQKEYVQWITEAKKPETRQRRLDKTLQMLKEKTKHP